MENKSDTGAPVSTYDKFVKKNSQFQYRTLLDETKNLENSQK